MPIFEVVGWEKTSAKSATWYIDAHSKRLAEIHASRAGLTDPSAKQIGAPPEGAVIVKASDKHPQVTIAPSLFWTFFFAAVLANLVSAVILGIIASL